MSNKIDVDIEKLIETLRGTCLSLQEGLYRLCDEDDEDEIDSDDLSPEQEAQIDQEIFRCETCSWWFEICEQCSETENCGNGDCDNCCQEDHGDEED